MVCSCHHPWSVDGGRTDRTRRCNGVCLLNDCEMALTERIVLSAVRYQHVQDVSLLTCAIEQKPMQSESSLREYLLQRIPCRHLPFGQLHLCLKHQVSGYLAGHHLGSRPGSQHLENAVDGPGKIHRSTVHSDQRIEDPRSAYLVPALDFHAGTDNRKTPAGKLTNFKLPCVAARVVVRVDFSDHGPLLLCRYGRGRALRICGSEQPAPKAYRPDFRRRVGRPPCGTGDINQ